MDIRPRCLCLLLPGRRAERYQNAKYGELRVDDQGNSILIGLRDQALQPLGPAE
ncbi:MAG: hypothetical protein R2932_59385 [Caldilineaceae bacterium]